MNTLLYVNNLIDTTSHLSNILKVECDKFQYASSDTKISYDKPQKEIVVDYAPYIYNDTRYFFQLNKYNALDMYGRETIINDNNYIPYYCSVVQLRIEISGYSPLYVQYDVALDHLNNSLYENDYIRLDCYRASTSNPSVPDYNISFTKYIYMSTINQYSEYAGDMDNDNYGIGTYFIRLSYRIAPTSSSLPAQTDINYSGLLNLTSSKNINIVSPEVSNLTSWDNIYDNSLYKNKKLQIVYNSNVYNLNYKARFKEFISGVYYMDYCYIEFPIEVPLTTNTLYPVLIGAISTPNTVPNISDSDMLSLQNYATLGTVNRDTGDITLLNQSSNVKYKNNHTYYNYYIFKDFLFTTELTDSTNWPSYLYCNIYYDNTSIYTNIKIGTNEQVDLNLYIYAKYDVSKIYYEVWYDRNCKSGQSLYSLHQESSIDLDTTRNILSYDGSLYRLNSIVSNIVQNASNQNCIILDNDADSTSLEIFPQVFKKYSDLYDYKLLYNSGVISSDATIDYTSIGYLNELEYHHILSDNGQFNKPGEFVYSLAQFINVDAESTLYYKSTYLIKMIYNGFELGYQKVQDIPLPFDIAATELEDALHYSTDNQYIELSKNSMLYTYYIDVENNNLFYQGNIVIDTDDTLGGLHYYPIKSIQHDTYNLCKISPNSISDKSGNTHTLKIYNYDVLIDGLTSSNYDENMVADTLCPYNNIYASDDRKYLFIELNEDVYLHNLNNHTLISINEQNTSFVNYNNTSTYYGGQQEMIKYGNNVMALNTFNTDDFLADNNWRIDGTTYTPIIAYDTYDYNSQFKDVNIMQANMDIDKVAFMVFTLKSDSTLLVEAHYPYDIILYKNSGEYFFKYPTAINNMSIDFIQKYYTIKRFIMKSPETVANILVYYQ